MVYAKIIILSLVVVSLVAAQYSIVQDENLHNYNIVSETTTRTYTECILKCDHDASCSFISIKENGDGTLLCISLVEKVRILNLSNPNEYRTENSILTTKKIGNHVSFLEQLNKTHPPCTAWGDFSKCSVTCGDGTKFRKRTCRQKCQDGTREEYVKEKETEKCMNEPCEVQQKISISQRREVTLGCIPTTKIVILSAIYGNYDRQNCVKDVTEKVNELCTEKQSCLLKADDQIYTDPCYRFDKKLFVTYVCRPVSPPTNSLYI